MRRNWSSGMGRTPCEEYTNKKNKQRVEPKLWQTGCSPHPPVNPILTKFGVWGGLPDFFLKFEFQDDRSINVGAVGVEICLFPLTRLIAYTTACSYRTSRDLQVEKLNATSTKLVRGYILLETKSCTI